MITGLVTAISVIGSTAGSLAWYVYSRATRVEFVGTSIAKSALLTVGIVDNAPYKISDQKRAEYKLDREEFDGRSIVFARSSDGLSAQVIKEYLSNSNYALDMLYPVTTQKRTITDQSGLTLYGSPLEGETNIARVENLAETNSYVKLPLAFRMKDTNGDNRANMNIWLTDATVKANGENIDQAVRIFMETSQRKFLMKPADKTTSNGATNVGGQLDLNNDGFYDYDKSSFEELYYGQHTGGATPVPHATTEYGIDEELAQLDNVNHVINPSGASTFLAKHEKHSYIADLSGITPETAEYYSLGRVKPSVDPDTGKYIEDTTGFMIATTNSTDKIGYATLTIYIEGWDHAVIDPAAGYAFNLSLKFETDRD